MTTKSKKVSLDTLLKKKGLIEEDITPFSSDFFDGEIDIETGKGDKLIEVMASKNSEIYKYYEVIYTTCPVFRSKELITEFVCDDPILVVQKVFSTNMGELMELGNYILKSYGLLNSRILKIKKP